MDLPEKKLYTLSMDYMATGEGTTRRVLVTVAYSEGEARVRFWTTFFPGDEFAEPYFGGVLQVTLGVDHELLGRWLAPHLLDQLEEWARESGAMTLWFGRSFNQS